MLAASCRTGTIKVRQSIWSNAHHGDPTRHDRYNSVKGTRSPWIHRREKRQTIRRNSRRIDRQPTFPIVSSSPPRLRPSEVCQRGPPSPSRHCCATARIEKPSGFRTLAASAKVLCQNCISGHSSRSRPKTPCCAAHQGRLCAGSGVCNAWAFSRQRTFMTIAANGSNEPKQTDADLVGKQSC